jgi:hypothetical protein
VVLGPRPARQRASWFEVVSATGSLAVVASTPLFTYVTWLSLHSHDGDARLRFAGQLVPALLLGSRTHIGGTSSDHRSNASTSPNTSTPAASDAASRPQTMRRSCSAVPQIRTEASRGSRVTTLSPRPERSSHHRSLRSLHSKFMVGPAGAFCAARDAATKTSRYSSIPSAATSDATESSWPNAASVSQR